MNMNRKAPLAFVMAVLMCVLVLAPVTALAASMSDGATLTITQGYGSRNSLTVNYSLTLASSTNLSDISKITFNALSTNPQDSENTEANPVAHSGSVTFSNLYPDTRYYVTAVIDYNDGSKTNSNPMTATTYSFGWYDGGRYDGGWYDSGRWDGWHDPGYDYYDRNRTYYVTSQTGSYTGSGNASFTIDANSNNFQSMAFGSTKLTRGTHYSVTGSGYGSTYITVYDSYLQTLANGIYTVYFNFPNGMATASFTVSKPVATPTPAPIVTLPSVPGVVTPITGTGNYIVSVRSALNVRSSPNAYGAKLGNLANGTSVTVGTISGGWGNINYGGTSAWVSMAYLLPTGSVVATTSGTYTVTGYVNMRLGPGTSFGIAGMLPPGTIVQVQLFSGSYGLANINGQNVYLHRNYLR